VKNITQIRDYIHPSQPNNVWYVTRKHLRG